MPEKRSILTARTWLIRCAMDSRVPLVPGGREGLTALAGALLELEQRQATLAAAMLEMDGNLQRPLPNHLRVQLRSYVDGK